MPVKTLLENQRKNILSVKNLSFGFASNQTILDDISFDIKTGEFVGIIGPNGSGKTTLVKCILGLYKCKYDQINLFNTPISKFKNWHIIGFVSQVGTSQNIDFPLTTKELLEISFTHDSGLGEKFAIDKVLDFLSIHDLKNKSIRSLSGGQKQKVFIASSIINEPKLLFLDEPTMGIDQISEQDFFAILNTLRDNLGTTVVMISHDIGTISQKVDKILCLNGKLCVIENSNKSMSGKVSDEISEFYHQNNLNFLVHRH